MKDYNENNTIKFLIVLGKLHSSIFNNVEKHIKTLNLNISEFLVMYAISANGPLSIQNIASRIFITSGNMTYTVNKLEKRGFVKRINDKDDHRKTYIQLTNDGNIFWNNILEKHLQHTTELFSNIDENLLVECISNMKEIGNKTK